MALGIKPHTFAKWFRRAKVNRNPVTISVHAASCINNALRDSSPLKSKPVQLNLPKIVTKPAKSEHKMTWDTYNIVITQLSDRFEEMDELFRSGRNQTEIDRFVARKIGVNEQTPGKWRSAFRKSNPVTLSKNTVKNINKALEDFSPFYKPEQKTQGELPMQEKKVVTKLTPEQYQELDDTRLERTLSKYRMIEMEAEMSKRLGGVPITNVEWAKTCETDASNVKYWRKRNTDAEPYIMKLDYYKAWKNWIDSHPVNVSVEAIPEDCEEVVKPSKPVKPEFDDAQKNVQAVTLQEKEVENSGLHKPTKVVNSVLGHAVENLEWWAEQSTEVRARAKSCLDILSKVEASIVACYRQD